MTWERALEADARLAAKNAVIIRAALRQSFDAERAFIGYQNTSPNTQLSLPQQRARARSWAILNIRPNMEPLRQALYKTWLEAYALGDLAAREAIAEMEKAQKADVGGMVDWSKWKPGDAVSALILKPPRAFQRLLEGAGITLKGFSDTTLSDIGNSIGEAIELGLSAKQAAKIIRTHVASPARALSIAVTEQNRAISAATSNRYLEAGLSQQKWLVFEPCDVCAKNADIKVSIGAPFPSGDTQPPAHPNCRCALAPVVPGVDDPANTAGSVTTEMPEPQPVEAPIVTETPTGFRRGGWKPISREKVREDIIDRIQALNPSQPRQVIIDFVDSKRLSAADRNIIKNGIILQNGPVQVRFYASGAKIPDAKKKELLELIEALQLSNPVPSEKLAINIGSTSTRKYGWAEIGGEQMWITPQTILTDTVEKTRQEGKFKMPVLLTSPQRDYTLTHEWGHLIDANPNPYGGGQNATTSAAIARLKRQFPDSFKSEYSGKNSKEFYAEMFTEWYLSKGKTENELVQAMAKEFGWRI